jgi:hypothetical protein
MTPPPRHTFFSSAHAREHASFQCSMAIALPDDAGVQRYRIATVVLYAKAMPFREEYLILGVGPNAEPVLVEKLRKRAAYGGSAVQLLGDWLGQEGATSFLAMMILANRLQPLHWEDSFR